MTKKIILASSIVWMYLFVGCELLDESDEMPLGSTPLAELDIPMDFTFSTKQEVAFTIKTITPGGQILAGTRVNISAIEEGEKRMLFSGTTNAEGLFEKTYTVPAALDSVAIETSTIGLVSQVLLPVNSTAILCDFGNLPESNEQVPLSPGNGLGKASADYKVGVLGGFNWRGVPDYLTDPDNVSSEFLNDVNASIPENAPVPEFNPNYLAAGNQINTLLEEPGDVWVTFVHEGAGYRNVLAFFSYESNNPPQSVNDIDSVTVVFPNVSYQGSGGGLNSGDKVYLGHFPAGTEIAWVLFANGWQGEITQGHMQVYSIPEFNPEPDPLLQQHNVLLYDGARDLTVLGFEDLNRAGNCDNDFNDALFYVTSNPRTAIVNTSVEEITYTGNDSDGDGVNDPVDSYPDDPDRAFNNFHPSQDTYGSLSFEDLWPARGDYDFNDLVVDYQFTEIMNAENMVVELEVDLILKASGASYENAFGFEMDISPSLVSSVTGNSITGTMSTFLESGLEANQDKAVVIAFDNVYSLVSRPSGYYYNTQENAPYVTPDTLRLFVAFTEPLDPQIVGTPPYNPFMVVNQDRAREVHLADHAPTTLAAGSDYFDSADDHSSVNGYYRTSNSLPWALDIVETLDYPVEKATINSAHIYFESWAISSGSSWSDWYKEKPGYRAIEHIYSK